MTLKIGRISKFRDLNSQLGLAQIPLMIGLLIMAVAIPVATKLSEQNADTRNMAREIDCTSNSDCGTNYKCISYQCVYVAPTRIPTKTPTGSGGSCDVCSNGQKKTCTTASGASGYKYCEKTGGCWIWGNTCVSATGLPTLTSTPRPTATPVPSCGGNNEKCCPSGPFGCLCDNGKELIGDTCRSCASLGQSCAGVSCCGAGRTAFCDSSRTCKPYVTSTPTPKPTSTSGSLSDGTRCSTVNQGGVANPGPLCSACKNGFYKTSAVDTTGYCGKQPNKCQNQNGTYIFPKPEGCGICVVNLDCATGYCSKSEGGICRKAPTATPGSLSDGTRCSTVNQGGVANPGPLCSACKNGYYKLNFGDTSGICGKNPDKCRDSSGLYYKINVPDGCNCSVSASCASGACSSGKCVSKATSCFVGGDSMWIVNGQTICNPGGMGVEAHSYTCRNGTLSSTRCAGGCSTCVDPTTTPIKPTATPTYAGSVCCHTNQSAVFNWYLNKCPTGYEIATDASCRTPRPTIVPTVGACKATGQVVFSASQCCSKKATMLPDGQYECLAATCESIGTKATECGYRPDCRWDGAKCVTKSTITPTKAVTTVTPVCKEGSFKCSSQTLLKCISSKWVTSDVCVTPEYCLATSDGNYGVCVSNNTLKCYCNLNCGAGDCNWQNAADSFYNRSCSFDTCSSLGVPTPKPTAVTTNYCYCSGNCGIGDCKWASSGSGSYTRRCDNQYCQGIPTLRPPTAAPTSVAGCYCNQRDCYSGGCSWRTTASGYRCPVDFCSAQKPTLTPSGGVVTKTPSGGVVTKAPTGAVATKPPSSGSCSGAGADICNTDKLSVRAVCVNGKWDYDEQLCGAVNACNRTEVCSGRTYYCGKDGKWSTGNDSCSSSSSCQQCPTDFVCYKNGSEYRWFVSGYVQGGFIRAGDNECTTNGVVKPAYLGKQKGDGNCDGKVDVTDYSLWHTEYYGGGMGNIVRNTWNSDFTGASGTCDGKVTVDDFSLWYKFFYDLNNGN